MKITLVNPVTIDGTRVLRVERCQQKIIPTVGNWPPITLLEIAAELKSKEDNDVKIIDGEAEGLTFLRLIELVASNDPEIAVIHSTTPTIEDDISFAALLKNKLPDLETVFTGLPATTIPGEILKFGSVDYAVMGEPQDTIRELVECRSNNIADLSRISGLGYKIDGRVIINKRRAQKETYDYRVFPDRFLIDNDRYRLPLTGKKFTVIKTSRGCDFSCSFCTSEAYYGRGWRPRSVENIMEEIRQVEREHGIDNFLFISDTFNGNSEFVKELSRAIIASGLNIKWVSNSRLDLVDEESVFLMKESGCVLVSLGIESYDEGVLRKNKKFLKREAIDKGIGLFKKHGILTYGYFILGLEGETKMSIFKTIIKAALSKLDFAIFYTLTPYPGTEYFNKFVNNKWKEYFHGISNIVTYRHLSGTEIKAYIYLASVLFYSKPKRLNSFFKYFLRGRLL